MLISYIVPVYNAYPYLRRCINSIINQSYKNIEIILIDDGSTDGCRELCEEIKKENLNVSVFHITNHGASYARQYGLKKAQGDIVGFVDSDDVLHPQITDMLAQPLLFNKEIMISACKVEKKIETGYESNMNFKTIPADSDILNHDILMKRFFKYEFWGYPAKLYRKTIFDGIFFPRATICEDYVVMSQLLLKARYIYYLNSPLYFYNVHIGGLSTLPLNAKKFEELDNMEWGYYFFSKSAPQYASYARSLLLESCIKLYGLIYKERKEVEYKVQRKRIKTILLKNIFFLTYSRSILYKVKIYSFLLLLFPRFLLLKK